MVMGVVCLSSCEHNQESRPAVAVSHVSPTDQESGDSCLCYQRVSGLRSRDTSLIRLDIEGHKVRGKMMTTIYQKDRRSGTLTGELKGQTINAIWIFGQEGLLDSIRVEFILMPDELLRKEVCLVKKNKGKMAEHRCLVWVSAPKIACGGKCQAEPAVR
jgi:hypothetical protein